jgi:hypothetical protein
MMLVDFIARTESSEGPVTHTHELYTPIWPFLADASRFLVALALGEMPPLQIECVPWKMWGPESTRWACGPALEPTFRHAREGARLVAPGYAVDFAPFVLRRLLHRRDRLSPSSSPDVTKPLQEVGERSQEAATLGAWRVVEETTTLCSEVFADGEVESRLPYFERTLRIPAEADDFMLVGDTVIGVNVSVSLQPHGCR